MFFSRLYQKSIFYSYAFIIYYWLFLMFQPSIIAAMPSIYYPKLLIVTLFIPVVLVTIFYLLFKLVLPKKINAYFFAIVPSGILTFLIYIYLDKLIYSQFSKSSLDLNHEYKSPFLLALFLSFLTIYYFHLKGSQKSSSKLLSNTNKYFIIIIFLSFIGMCGYFFLNQKGYDLKIVKNENYNSANVLIVSIDGAENDLMSVYKYKNNTTPFLRSIKNEFMIADNFYTNNCCTFGSITSMYTAKLPLDTRVVFPGSHLKGNDRFEHLPWILKKLGYETIQLSTLFYAEPVYMALLDGFEEANYRKSSGLRNLVAGFLFYEKVFLVDYIFLPDIKPRLLFFLKNDKYVNPYKDLVAPNVNNSNITNTNPFSDENKTEYISKFILTNAKSRPFFIHLHLMDTHTIDPIEYDRGMLKSDKNIKLLYSSLEKNHLLEKTIFIITSDHNFHWSTEKPIPLLIRFPNLIKSGENVIKNTQIIDLAPTILDYIGIEKPKFMLGYSLLKPELIDENRPIKSVASIAQKDGYVDFSKKNFGVNQIKIQICNKYEIQEIDSQNRIIKSNKFHGYASRLPCLKK